MDRTNGLSLQGDDGSEVAHVNSTRTLSPHTQSQGHTSLRGTLKNLVELSERMAGCKSSSSVTKKKKRTVAGEGRSAAFPRVAKLGLCRNA